MWHRLRPAAMAACLLTTLAPGVDAQTGPKYRAIGFDQLLGWAEDDHRAALEAFLKSCEDISAREWRPLCSYGAHVTEARAFFETFFRPVVVHPGRKSLFTGYFEPVLNGSRQRGGKFQTAIYAPPKFARDENGHWPSRAQIVAGALAGQGLEIAWVDDPVAAHYLHIQGSGRITFQDGTSIRVGYAAENGYPFRSAAGELLKSGEISSSQANINGLRRYYAADPVRGQDALNHNGSFVFFRVVDRLPEEHGPLGALERPMTALRSLAVDPRYTQMGAPVWVEKGGRNPIRRLMVAQDTGAAIKGPQRADIFFGTGDEAGRQAQVTRDSGRLVVLLPIDIALALDPVN
jgi:membrane-bound lytic murein transglycosylase A